MNYLIKIEQRQIGTELVESVNARELHEKLQVITPFSIWIQRRLEETMAQTNIDYSEMSESSLSNKIVENPLGGRPSKNYVITLDIAKHMAMLERSEIGRQIRQYFIDFEKQARQKKASLDFLSKEAEASKRLAAVFGLTGNQALLSANKVMQKTYGIDCIKLLEVDLVSEKQPLPMEIKPNKVLAWATKKNIQVISVRTICNLKVGGLTTAKLTREVFEELVTRELAVWTRPNREIRLL